MARILVVDDEQDIRDLLSDILRDEGYSVQLAANGIEAQNAKRQGNPDLILLDIWLPDTDGISLLRQWSTEPGKLPPVIVMSGHGTIDTAVEATRLGAFEFLEKPIALKELLSAIQRALQTADKPLLTREVLELPMREARERFEQVYLQQQLAACGGKVGRLAERVGMERTHLYRKLRALNVRF
ncbi:MAG: response regulator [Gammaproteobacteria bacterium]|nr:response regulator [Gammaproteobacteria bacterium]